MIEKRDEGELLFGFFFSSLDGRKEGKRRSRPLPRPGKLAGYRMIPKRDGANFAGGRSCPKRVEERIAGIMDLPILAGIGEAGYVWIPICFKGLKAFSCRQGRGVLNTPSECPPRGRMGLLG